MDIAFGNRLGEMVTEKESSLSEAKEMSKPNIHVEEIVSDTKLAYVQRLSASKEEVAKSLLSVEVAKVREIGELNKEISHLLLQRKADLRNQKHDVFQIVECFVGSSGATSRMTKMAITSLVRDMTERYAFPEMYRDKIAQLRVQLALKEDSIREMTKDLALKNMNRQLPEIALQLAAVIESNGEKSGAFISLFTDVLRNNIKDTKRWNDNTKSLFAIILDYGGPSLLKIIKEKIGGPSLQTTYATARSKVPIPTKLEQFMFSKAALFYDSIGYKGPFVLAIDATAILPCLRVKGKRLIGIAVEEDIFVHTAQDIIDITKDETKEKARLANAFVLTPLQEHVPSLVVAVSPVVKGQDSSTVREWFRIALNMGAKEHLQILGIGADGDSKFRKYYVEEFLERPDRLNEVVSVQHQGFNFFSQIKNVEGMTVPTLMFPDWKHLLKKWRNQILNVRRMLVLGNGLVMVEDLMRLYESKKLKSGLWKSDVFVKDKKNVDASIRILQPQVRQYLREWNEDQTVAFRVYLKVGYNMLQAYTKENLPTKERAKLAWSTVCFLKLWKAWLEKSNYQIESSFISLQTYNDMIIAGHSIILSMKLFAAYFPDQPFHPSTFGSDSCERLFSRCRGFCKGKTNLCMLDLLDICSRILKLEELKKHHIPNVGVNSWPIFVEEEILSGIREAEKEIIKTVEQLGMLPLLTASNILRKESNGDIVYLNPGMESTLADIRFEPDETDAVTVDELLEFHSDLLCSSAETSEECYSIALSDIAASSAQLAKTNVNDEEVDDDHPKHCHFFHEGRCKYIDPNYRAPTITQWIGCEFPECDNWFHELCLGLKFATELERDNYAFVCQSHHRISHHDRFKDRITVSGSDPTIITAEEEGAPSEAKRPRRSAHHSGSSFENTFSVPPNYVEYEGEFYHIAQFLSLQQGKVYSPSTSRMARWMAVARSDFYEKVESLVSPDKTENGLYFNDIAAFWMPRVGLRCGEVLRFVRKTSAKSAVPVFEWKKEKKQSTEKISVCFRVLSFQKMEDTKLLLEKTTDIMWAECQAYLMSFPVPDAKTRAWPLTVDGEALEKILPQLEKAEQERMLQEEKARAEEKERLKKGEPEDMTVRLLREVLDELNVTYKASDKKAVLIGEVREARQNLQGNTCPRSTPKNYQPEGGRAKHERYFTWDLNNRAFWFVPFYYDDKKERLLNLLLNLLFTLQVIGVYLDMLLYQQAVCLVMLASMYQFCLSRVIHEFFRMWMEVLSGWLYARVKIEAYADNCLIELTA